MLRYFVTAIDTDSGKTLVSAILCEALKADYWKPVQAGLPSDAETIRNLVSNEQTRIHPETFRLTTPASPHAAAKHDGVTIAIENLILPQTKNTLIIEGAGGVLVPLNDENFIIDLISRFRSEAILVADLYLGSINHTLLTIEAMQKRNIDIKGLVFNGESNPESENIILHHTGLRCLLRISKEKYINPEVVRAYASLLKKNWNG